MSIQIVALGESRPDDLLEAHRPAEPADWHLLIQGRWEQTVHHYGWAGYECANAGPGKWVLNCFQWEGSLDSLTQEDVDAGNLNAEQEQALWDTTLEEAQALRYCRIVAVATGVPETMNAEDIGRLMHAEVLKRGGFDVEPAWE